MPRHAVVRTFTLVLAFAHSFPARKHLTAFASAAPWSTAALTQGWQGFGAALATVLYLLPVAVQIRALSYLWRKRRLALRAAGVVLALAHLAPATDHVPRLLASPNWGDAWRGVGAALAVVWFLAPLPAQARFLFSVASLGSRRSQHDGDRHVLVRRGGR